MNEQKSTYQCEACGLHYEDEAMMKKCYEFCAEYNACSLEITKYSVETKEVQS